MTLLSSEIVLYKSQTITETTSNGGRRGATKVTSGAVNNLFPLVLPEERTAGARKVRKVFVSVDNDDDETLYSAGIYIDAPTPGDDWVTMFAGTQRDTMADHTGSDNRYGVANLASNVAAGATTLIVNVEDATIASMFRDGGTICVTDRTLPTSAGSGNREFATISGAPSVSGTQVTITIPSPGLTNAYTTASGTRVAACLVAGDILCSVSNWAETSSAGTFDETTYPVDCDNLGTVEQTWTLTFSSATAFTVVGDTVGSVGSGTTSSDFAPSNPVASKPYFTLDVSGFGGTWASGDTIVFQTHPAGYPLYLDWIIPSGSDPVSSNRFTLVTYGYRA